MIHNEAPAIKERLSRIDGVASVTRGWPRSFAHLPCLAIAKAADTPVDFADDREYLTELEYTVRIFAQRIEEMDRLEGDVDEAMQELGYTRTACYEDDNAEVRMTALRYRKYV